MNRGRKIKTRGRVSISFKPHEQVLADRLTLHTKDGASINGVKVACLSTAGTTEDLGFMNIYNDETITVGWNCRLDHTELSIPRIAMGVVESRLDDDLSTREKRGIQDFSLLAEDSNGNEVVGISANDRISKFNNMMAEERPERFQETSVTDGMELPLILTLTVAVLGIINTGIAI